jgi:hypothetical protein
MNKIWIATGVLFSPGLAAAHLEHATGEDFGLVHYLVDPVHVGLTAAAVLLFLAARWCARRNRAVNRASQ